jgi:hypothetical protein
LGRAFVGFREKSVGAREVLARIRLLRIDGTMKEKLDEDEQNNGAPLHELP